MLVRTPLAVEVKSYNGDSVVGATGLAQAIRLSQEARLVRPVAQSPAVFACTRINADAFAGTPMRVWKTREEDADEAGPEDPLVRLLSRPNPLMGAKKFQRAISRALDLDGGVFLFLTMPGLEPILPRKMPAQVWPVRDALVTAIYDRESPWPIGWSFQIRERRYEFPLHSVARIYWPDDHNPVAAFGPTHAAWRAADHLFRAEAFDDALVENGGQMAGYFHHEERRIDEEKLNTLKKSIKQRVTKPSEDRSTPVLPAGLKFTPTAFTQVEMQAIEMRRIKREEIARTFGVPPVMLGELEDANRASLTEQRRVFYENTVIPRVEFIEEEIVEQLIPLLPEQFASYWVQFDVAQTAPMREDVDSQIGRAEKLVHLGVSFGEAAGMVGFDHDPVEGEDERWIDGTLRPVELALNPPAPLPVMDEPESEEEERRRNYQERREKAHRFEASLMRHDDDISRAAFKVFSRYLGQQRRKLRNVAGRKGSEPVVVRPWNWFTDSGSWSTTKRAYAELMEMIPDREWVMDVRGISADELEQLLLRNEQRWGEELWAALEKPIRVALLDSARDVASELGKVAISAQNPRVLRHMATKQVLLSEGPMSVVAERVRAAIVRSMANASSVGTLADRVREVLEELESQLTVMREQLGTRAMLIARSESASAANAGRVAQFRESGIAAHEWVTAGDDLVRPQHQIDGEVQIVGQRFSNGLAEPGEAGAPVELVANCRCTTAPVIADESESPFAASLPPSRSKRT